MHVLHVQTTLLPEAIVLALSLMLASVAAAEVVSGFDVPPPVHDPCHDGRYSQGRAMSCGELLRQLDREEALRRSERWRSDPCRDGRYSTGRRMTCAELRERLERRERRLPPWRDERPYGLGESPRDSG